MRVVVCGWVAGFPVAGFLWHPLGFALGMRDLGHDVWFLDDQGWSAGGFDPLTGEHDPDCAAGERFLRAELAEVGLGDRWALRRPSGRVAGLAEDALLDVLADADVLVNVSLMLPDRPEYQRVPHRFAIDTDPVFTQVAAARGSGIPERHTRLFTFGRPPLPGQRPGEEWVPTRQAVHLPSWPIAPDPTPGAPFTTVTAWQAYAPLTWDGAEYGMKDRSILEHLDLPARSSVPLTIGLAGGVDRGQGARFLRAHGWTVDDALAPTVSSAAYRAHIASSAGEIGFAKHGYVVSRSGWFSDRTSCYLASGRAAVVQDTGWSEWLPSGEGLFAFTTTHEAAMALEEVAADPARHAAAARKVAEEHLDAQQVCASLLEAGL